MKTRKPTKADVQAALDAAVRRCERAELKLRVAHILIGDIKRYMLATGFDDRGTDFIQRASEAMEMK